MPKSKTLIVVVGSTAVGKTRISIEIAKHYQTDILSADSRQFYRELRIGTAVPSFEELTAARHHFIQHLSVLHYYNASMFEQNAIALLDYLFQEKNQVVMVGGSGMYIDAVCDGIDDIPDIDMELRQQLDERLKKEGVESLRFDLKKLDPIAYEQIDLKNKARILRALEVCMQTGKPFSSFKTQTPKNRDFKVVKIGLTTKRERLYNIINQRVDNMIDEGLVDEARNVIEFRNFGALKTVGYRELFDCFDKKITMDTAIELIKRNTRHYAKRQITWFNRYDDIAWFEPENVKDIIKHIEKSVNCHE